MLAHHFRALGETRRMHRTNQSRPFFFAGSKKKQKNRGSRNLAKFSAPLPAAFKLATLKQKTRLFGSGPENSSRQISKAERRDEDEYHSRYDAKTAMVYFYIT